MRSQNDNNPEAGFSLVELMIALTVTMVLLGISSNLLVGSLNIGAREDTRTAALADAQQALNVMSRDIANAGFGLTSNGVVAANSDEGFIRVRANLNAFSTTAATRKTVTDADEDISFTLQANPDGRGSALVRSDINSGQAQVLSSRLEGAAEPGLAFRYLKLDGTPAVNPVTTAPAPDQAERIEITIRVLLPQVGVPRMSGYQPQSSVFLSSEVMLRNRRLLAY
ncbi:MAG: prepilin-type N-terminal cleavage/methylation domain-containing protein [Pyrinomonadaceae bacterium MAG19_C2-C3]|nr:prepilin-type N-terminal cleavage/methylation domain-containing protein [Pyrinomonadaceae bacterium MAG19_C2-C3]